VTGEELEMDLSQLGLCPRATLIVSVLSDEKRVDIMQQVRLLPNVYVYIWIFISIHICVSGFMHLLYLQATLECVK
jgi:hypothetical protein